MKGKASYIMQGESQAFIYIYKYYMKNYLNPQKCSFKLIKCIRTIL